MRLTRLLLSWFPLLLTWKQWDFPITLCEANPQAEFLYDVVISSALSRNGDNALSAEWPELHKYPSSSSSSSSVHVGPQKGSREVDKIVSLPDQPLGVEFDQYSGYVTVDPTAGRSLFYYFVESYRNSSAKPLVLWLARGPGCSSFGYGSFLQLGPFRVHSDGKTLYMNDYSWNKVANVLFLESPAGVGFSYSNTTSDYNTTGDKRTAEDTYTFLVNWFERFPQYKTRDFYLTGVSYGGRFVAQLAYTIVAHNQNPNQTFINLKDIASIYGHAMISDKTHAAINKYCDFDNANYSASCKEYISKGQNEVGPVLRDNIYSSACTQDALKPQSPVSGYDECSRNYVEAYLNRKNVQEALHAINTNWTLCSKYISWGTWKDSPDTVLPILKQLIANKVNIWILSGDIDGIISVTTTRLAVNAMQLAEVTDWHPWLSNQEVGGYVEGYKGLTLVTIRGAGHEFASYQPERSLAVISSFLQNKLPPAV